MSIFQLVNTVVLYVDTRYVAIVVTIHACVQEKLKNFLFSFAKENGLAQRSAYTHQLRLPYLFPPPYS